MNGNKKFIFSNYLKRFYVNQYILACLLFFLFSFVDNNYCYSFAYYEHKHIGDVAFQNAINNAGNKILYDNLRQLFKPNNNKIVGRIPRDYIFSFGDLAAMGDHYGNAKEIETLMRNINNKDGRNDQKFINIIKVVNYQFRNVEKWQKNLASIEHFDLSALPECYDSSDYENELFVFLPDFSYLSRFNENHFGDKALKQWKKDHKKALEYARQIMEKRITGRLAGSEIFENCKKEIILMLSYEGFAQHFLQDTFAAGHIDTKRAWHYPAAISEHEHNYYNLIGRNVKMKMPSGKDKSFKSYGDNCLFTPQAQEVLENVIEISSWSLSDIFNIAFNENCDSAPLAPTEETKAEMFLKRIVATNNTERPTATDKEEVPTYRWTGMSYATTFMLRQTHFRNERSAVRLDVGYEYGRSPFGWFPINYIGPAFFFFPGNEKSFHIVFGSTSFLCDDYYPSWDHLQAWTGLIFFDKLLSLTCDKIGLKEYLKAVKLDTKISPGAHYYTENNNIHVRTEIIYNFSLSIKVFRALNFRVSCDLLRGLGNGKSFIWRGFYRTGFGFEFVF